MHERKIPGSGERLPVLGMGTWQTFDETLDPATGRRLHEVLDVFFRAGGRVIDSSPMYGRAEAVVGTLLGEAPPPARPFLATKVWIRGKEEGIAQMRESMRRMGRETIDLMQVHNLVDVETHLATLRTWKEEGRVRYVGLTHYQLGAFAEIERLLDAHPIDFVQIPYSAGVREAERRLLPLAQERGIAVLVMRPLQEGGLVGRLLGRPLPQVAVELDCGSWSDLLLRFVVSHPAVTCAIPATGNPAHMEENMRALHGALPDDRQRRAIAEAIER